MHLPVSTIIVTWNSRATIEATLDALPPGGDVVVFDNASADGTAELVGRRFPSVRLVRSTRNLGFAGGVNAAARLARHPYLLLLNPDARPSEGAVARLAAFLDAHQDAAAAAGLLTDDRGAVQHGFAVKRLPTLGSLAADLLLVARLWPSNPVTARYLAADLDEREPSAVEQPAAACLMVRRSWFDRLDGFDERYWPAWFDDVDFCRRLRDAGGRAWCVPDARFAHDGGSSLPALGRAPFLTAYYANLRRYVARHHGRAARVLVGALVFAGVALRALVALASGQPAEARAYATALRDIVSGLPIPEAG